MTPPIRREAAGHFSPAVFLFPKTSIPVRQQLGPRAQPAEKGLAWNISTHCQTPSNTDE